jgi:hypothetical protein
MKFSQRQNITPSEKSIQLDYIDEDLLNSLWNIFKLLILDNLDPEINYRYHLSPFKAFSYSLWHDFYKLPIDTIPYRNHETKDSIRKWFFKAEWFEIYDFIEFFLDLARKEEIGLNANNTTEKINQILEREYSGYRIIQGKIAPITNREEINEFNSAINKTQSLTALHGCNIHLNSALSKISDKKNPDYRNSIKESISAIESLANVISNNANDSLGVSLDKIKDKIKIHPALEKGFKHIYGYTSDTDGIRHALTEESNCEFEDAKFMMISCSAFINYLITKTEKSGIRL